VASSDTILPPYASRGNWDFSTKDKEFEIVPRNEPINSVKDGPLSDSQLEDFAERGYLIFPGLFSTQEIAERRAQAQDLANIELSRATLSEDGRPEVGANIILEPPSNKIRSIFGVHRRDHPISTLASSKRIVDRAQQLVGSETYIHQCRANFQPAFVGNGFYWHSDFETWHSEDGMPLPHCLSAVVLMDDNHATNGALMVMPGSHKWYVRCSGRQPGDNWKDSLRLKQNYGTPSHNALSELAERFGITHCEAPAGSVLMFDCNLMHGSHTNISPFSRRNLFTVFNSVNNRLVEPFYADVKRPEEVASRQNIDAVKPAAP
jgi:ectoine hydroxylase